jgi:hypothetical protein
MVGLNRTSDFCLRSGSTALRREQRGMRHPEVVNQMKGHRQKINERQPKANQSRK